MGGIQLEGWLRAAVADAEGRGLTGLKPLLESLARATAGLREADRMARDEPGPARTAPTDARRG